MSSSSNSFDSGIDSSIISSEEMQWNDESVIYIDEDRVDQFDF